MGEAATDKTPFSKPLPIRPCVMSSLVQTPPSIEQHPISSVDLSGPGILWRGLRPFVPGTLPARYCLILSVLLLPRVTAGILRSPLQHLACPEHFNYHSLILSTIHLISQMLRVGTDTDRQGPRVPDPAECGRKNGFLGEEVRMLPTEAAMGIISHFRAAQSPGE